MKKQELVSLLEKYLNNQCSEDEKTKVHEWYNKIGKGEKDFKLIETESSLNKEGMWQMIKEKIKSESKESFNPLHDKRYFNFKWAAAAAILITVGVGVAWIYQQNLSIIISKANDKSNSFNRVVFITRNNKTIERHNDSPQVITIDLEDGSIIRLKPGGKITYPLHFEKENREIILKGEAFFEVAKDKKRPFMVYTGDLTTKVLGTSFNIKAYEVDNDIEVSVTTGKVSVFYDDKVYHYSKNTKVLLTPNQMVMYNKRDNLLIKSIVHNPVIVKKITSNDFRFDNARVSDVFEKVEELYGIKIYVEDEAIYNCNITAVFDDQPMMTRMDMICKSIGATYQIEGDHLIVSGRGCEE